MKPTSADHIQGAPSAPVVLIEYADYQCPYCRQAYYIVKKLQQKFGDELTFVFRNFPLVQLHPQALHAAMAAEAAGKQEKFWEMHDIIFENQRSLSDDSFLTYAREIGLDINKFKEDFASDEVLAKIEEDLRSGRKAGVEGTPSFFINGRFFDGNWTTSELDEYIEALI